RLCQCGRCYYGEAERERQCCQCPAIDHACSPCCVLPLGVLCDTLLCVRISSTLFTASWPGLSRPSTSCLFVRKEDVDARHKAGHDDVIASAPTAFFYPSQFPGTWWIAGKNMSCQVFGRFLIEPTSAMKFAYFITLSGEVVKRTSGSLRIS